MRSRAGPLGVLCLIASLAFTMTATTGCASTRDKLGGVVSAAGGLLSATGGILEACGDAILNGPAVDARNASEALGLSEPDVKAAPAPATAPAPAPVPPPGPSGWIRPPDEEEDLTAPVAVERLPEARLRPWYAAPQSSSFRPSTAPRRRC